MAIEQRVYKAQAGVAWFKAAWHIFKMQPGTFILMHAVMGGLGLVAIFFPILQIAAGLATPFLTAGFYQAILLRQQGKKITVAELFAPFGQVGRRLGLFRLGLYQIGAGILLALLASWLFKDAIAVLEQYAAQPEIAAQHLLNNLHFSNIVVFISALSFYLMCFAYAVPLVYFHGTANLLEVFKASLSTFWHNMAAIGVYGVIFTGLMLISVPLSFIPLFFIMPICYIAFFVSFQAMFMSTIVVAAPTNDMPTSSGRFDA
ncbi:BPSS1780 family membrane protein [Pseudoalteromonas tunicata]|jgi:hypothetical protein|uniref:Transmembrane protein n=1 Tax=Pseudoalteromonas tunicata D2 TaxID=87626 RepID=A4CCF6_9GAMM|nr:BPSS1780 family membrane protein [Pseudoalteromonas tunicata]ATC93752.1 hypothetical protein PTUN_a1058 [Pseudoalteromonas tunicata]AXT29575.1 hypothetical protein D1819_01190 [Pseudoalteromonas tunicata]EAR27249.1 hypothetical protein PTD2_14457 [Pseudoalteromonas tunicata D2]